MPSEATDIDNLKARLVTPRQFFDVDTLLHVQQQSVCAARESHWLQLLSHVLRHHYHTIPIIILTIVCQAPFFTPFSCKLYPDSYRRASCCPCEARTRRN